jgi:hypothetical protein
MRIGDDPSTPPPAPVTFPGLPPISPVLEALIEAVFSRREGGRRPTFTMNATVDELGTTLHFETRTPAGEGTRPEVERLTCELAEARAELGERNKQLDGESIQHWDTMKRERDEARLEAARASRVFVQHAERIKQLEEKLPESAP